jgi:hypothetical protein
MYARSTSATVVSAILLLVIAQQSATAKRKHARHYHPLNSQCCLLTSDAYTAPDYIMKTFDGLPSLANGAMASEPRVIEAARIPVANPFAFSRRAQTRFDDEIGAANLAAFVGS